MSIGKTNETLLKTESSPATTTNTTVIVPENSETKGKSVDVSTNSASKMISSVYLALVPVAFLAYL